MNRLELLSLVWEFYGVPQRERHPDQALIGIAEIAGDLGLSEKHTRDVLNSDVLISPWLQEEFCRLTYVAKPPDRMSIFVGEPELRERYWDELGLCKYRVCPPSLKAAWRPFGGPFFLRVVDVAKRFPKHEYSVLDILDGDMLLGDATKATLIPVCWDRDELRKMERFRQFCTVLKRCRAKSMPNGTGMPRIKSPDLGAGGWLKYAANHGLIQEMRQ